MKRLLYYISLHLLLMMLPLVSLAQGITVHGPSHVAAGQQFHIMYEIKTTDVRGFRMGQVPEEIDVIYGPSTSTQQSVTIVNGRTAQSSSVTYTYVLIAKKNGTYVIPAATAVVGGTKTASQALRINVSGTAPQQSSGGGGRGYQQSPQARVQRAGSPIRGNELFIKVSANKQRVYEQEPILLTYKVYTNLELTQLEGKMPDLNGFHSQEIPLPQQKSFHIEKLDGKPYRCVTWSQYVMFPQMSGKLEIPSITFKGIVMQEDPNVDPFEAFFNGGSGYVEVKKEIKAPAVQVMVDPLPQKPANFSGGVGRFHVSVSLDKKTVKAGDPVNVHFEVDGVGNLKLIRQPDLDLPKDFDKYDAKVTEKTKLTPEGLSGKMIYDMLIVPRNQGKYVIPAMQFVYFDTQSKSYKTLSTEPMELTVEKGDGTGTKITDYSQRDDNDIHDLMTSITNRENPEHTFFGSAIYWMLNVLILTAFLVLVIVFRKRAMDMANVSAMRGKKANKVAAKRLKAAAGLMAAGKENDFYDEVLRALWGYAGDKLTMPVEQLSRDNISDNLIRCGVSESVIATFIEALDECEYARFAPRDAETTANDIMQKTYDKANEAITEIEGSMKKGQGKPAEVMAMLITLIVLAMSSLDASAADASVLKANADAAYRSGNYQQAVELYQQEQKNGMSAEAYYNIGNAYFRMDQIPQAVLAYERASLLSPSNDDIQHNLNIARSKTVDKLPAESTIFFSQWWAAIVNMMSIDSWALMALVSLIVALLLFLSYLFLTDEAVRRMSFYGSASLLLLFFCANVFAWQRKSSLQSHDRGVVMTSAVTVKTAPETKASDSCVIHEGTAVRVTDKDMKGWYGIQLSDGREGWVQTNDIELI